MAARTQVWWPRRTAPWRERGRHQTFPNEEIPGSVDDGVKFYALWDLNARLAAEPAMTETVELHELEAPVLLEYDVSDLAAAGVNPATLQIWTRPDPAGPWLAVPVQAYDEERKVVSAWLEHFSEFGLGQGLDQSGDLLPNLRAFTADELTGAAEASVPIEVPAGLGGLRPNLALRYSSVTMDDLFRLAGDYDIEAQASSVGIGWHLDGVSYIARVDGNLDDDTADTLKKFALVLDGTRVGITFESGAWHTNPETFASIRWNSAQSGDAHDWGGWTVVTTNGTKYEFGDATPFAGFASTTANATFLQRTNGRQHLPADQTLVSAPGDRPAGQLPGIPLPRRAPVGDLRRQQLLGRRQTELVCQRARPGGGLLER